MIVGVGLDLCEVSRMAEAISHPRFLERVFSMEERAYLTSKGKTAPQTAAGLFAAKEAYLKARGTGIDTLALSSIEILHDERGKPFYHLAGETDAAVHLSITHEAGCAAAVCILESREAKHDGSTD